MAETWKKLAFYDEVATSFLALPDTPAAYVTVLAYYRVNAAGDAVEEGLVAGAASGLATLDGSSVCAQEPKLHAAAHEATGGDELDLTGMKADSILEKTTDTGVTVDTCLIKDGKVADSNLLEGSTKAEVQTHAPASHALSGHTAAVADVPFGGFEATDMCLDNQAANPTPVLGKIYFKTDGDLHPYICTAVS